jgi:hypothetical protein
MIQYFDLEYQPLTTTEGLQEYLRIRSEEGVEIAETFLSGKLAFVLYQGISVDALPSFHLGRYQDTDFQLQAGNDHYYFDKSGRLTSQKRQSEPRPDLLLEEEFDATGQLTGGTLYVMQDEDIRYAVEFDGNRHYFNCYDFEESESIPVAAVQHLLP